jgi:DNA repair exonuclease SbcCD ATPase subunit
MWKPKYEELKFEGHSRGKVKKRFTTNTKRARVIMSFKRKDNTMTEPTKKQKADWKLVSQKSALLLETIFRTYVGYIMLTQFETTASQAVGLYALATAGILVVYHFLNSK